MTQAKIDWPNRVIIGASGTKYKITPETMSSARYIEFEIRSMTQAFKTNLEGILTALDSIEHQLVKGELNQSGNIHNALTILQNFKNGLRNHAQYKRTESIEFCALFCIEDGEDVSEYSETMVRRKWDDWKSIPDEDFFLLSMNVKILLSARYRKMIQAEKESLANATEVQN